MLLKAARWTGNVAMANSTWKSLVRNHFSIQAATKVVPDTECFNHYLATLCCCEPYQAISGQERSIDRLERLPHIEYFREMAELGLVADEETLCILMVASGREADLTTVASILNRVWNIDVEKIMSNEQLEIQPVEGIAPNSALYPSAELLLAIAHIYGTNSDIPTAIRLVDLVSRAYSIEIHVKVWLELLQWTHVLAARSRGLAAKERQVHVGQLPPSAVLNLWSIMTSEPYNVNPTMRMYDFLIGSLIMSASVGKAQTHMQEALALHKRHVNELNRHRVLWLTSSRENPNSMVTAKHERNYNYRLLRVQRNRQYFRLWFLRIIHKGSKTMGNVKKWYQRNVPDLVRQWISYAPKVVSYEIDTGTVELRTGARTLNKARMARRTFGLSISDQQKRREIHLRRLMKKKRDRTINREQVAADEFDSQDSFDEDLESNKNITTARFGILALDPRPIYHITPFTNDKMSTASPETIAAYFSGPTEDPTKISESFIAQIRHRIDLVDFWEIPPSSHVLEIGCGQGDTTIVLADRVGPDGHVDALDPGAPDYGICLLFSFHLSQMKYISSPQTLSSAQAQIKSSPVGNRITFHNTFPVPFLHQQSQNQAPLQNSTKKYSHIILSHCSFYFSSPHDLAQIITECANWSDKICFAEWSLQARELEMVPHLLSVLLQATCFERKGEGDGNVRCIRSPERVKEVFLRTGWEVERERMEGVESGVRDGEWEVGNVRRWLRGEVEGEEMELGLKGMYDAMETSVQNVEGGVKGVRSMDVWAAVFVRNGGGGEDN
ncbi:SAM-dependent methyltransferase protein [Rutstroemia sp. NJR-2017a BBW]|nr:SAM-dependent methyltransferase protein [Rutstroemia sp. NJR-2017a BBW]